MSFSQGVKETDVDQLVRVLGELEKAFRKVSGITDQFTQTTFKELMKETTAFMKLERTLRVENEKYTNNLKVLNQKTLDRLKIQKVQYQDELAIRNQRSHEARVRAAEKMVLQKQHAEDVRSHILLRNQMKRSSDGLAFFTRALTKGVTLGAVGGMGVNNLYQAYSRRSNIRDVDARIAAARQTQSNLQASLNIAPNNAQTKKDLEDILRKLDNLITEKMSYEQGAGQGTDQFLGKRGMDALMAIGDFGKRHAKGLIVGAVFGGVLLEVLKKAIDVSPVFQSMLKLLNYGFTLLLRPIGDFFGFILRPIVILLLRRFIIPFYQHLYPKLMKLGTEIGDVLAERLGNILSGDPKKVIEGLLGISETNNPFENFTNAVVSLGILIGGATVTGVTLYNTFKTLRNLVIGLNTFLNKILGKPPTTTPTTTTTTTTKPPTPSGSSVNKTPVGSFGSGKFVGGTGGQFMGTGTPSGTKKVSTYSKNPAIRELQKFLERVNEIKNRRGYGLDYLVEQTKQFMQKHPIFGPKIDKSPVGGIGGGGVKFTEMLKSFLNRVGRSGNFASIFVEDFARLAFPNIDWSGTAPRTTVMGNGGIISEPVYGVGKSGRNYLLGEKGSEMVVPMGKSGGGGVHVTINIANMNGSREDINKLKDVVLRVMQESSAKMVR